MENSENTNGQFEQPNINRPIINPTNQATHTSEEQLGLLSEFIGTWNSPRGAAATGYNVMPLPQVGAENGYITKNFPYYEEITFAPIAGGAPNREGNFTQSSGVLFYEQRVYFANNEDPKGNQPIQDTLVHAENGSWLYHTIGKQLNGPYGPDTLTPPVPMPVQPPSIQYNKQVSVPHGNSILMAGGPVQTGKGNPDYAQVQALYLNSAPFSEIKTVDPVSALEKQIADLAKKQITITDYSSIAVSSENVEGGGISNILFENKFGKVTKMDTIWYVQHLSDKTTQLQYVQVIWMEFKIGNEMKSFVHVDANTLVPARFTL